MKEFKDELNTAVITTKYVLEENSSILFVYHYDAGFWQFSGKEEDLQDSDYRVISLQEVIAMDSSIIEVSDLDFETMAYRESINSDWEIDNL